MRLSKFILSNLEVIVTEWESFASTVLPEKQLDRAALRNDAARMLSTIARDMETPQTASQQTAKSQGLGPNTTQDTQRKAIVSFDLGRDLTRCKECQSSAPFGQPSLGSG